MLVVICLGVGSRWYPIILDLHRFFIAISRAVVTHDGRDGLAPDPLVWSAGALQEASAGSCSSGLGFSPLAAWYLGFGMG